MIIQRLYAFLGFATFIVIIGTVVAEDSYRNFDECVCPVLDMPFQADEGIYGGFAPEADTTAAGWGKMAVIELGAWIRILNWETDFGSDLDMQLKWDTMLLYMNETSDAYPLSLGRVYLQWSHRYENGLGFELDTAPGIYSALQSLDGNDFSVPFGGSLIYAFTPWAAIWGGVSVYPTFKQIVDPRIGVRLAYRDRVVLDAAYPESRLELKPFSFLRLSAGGRASLWPEFNMGNDARECLYYEELRAYAGIDIAMGKFVELALQGGYIFNRKIRFREEASDIEVDDAPFARIGLNGHF